MNNVEKLFFNDEEKAIQFRAITKSMTIMKSVKTAMKPSGISNSDLATRLNITETELDRLFKGHALLDMLTIARLQHIFPDTLTDPNIHGGES